ncbi:hypothetical protein [Halogeometricum luteum]|uniref:Small CPxCG-related zinc finger protein n=1 Tax=Halogeometricum luteum TaxID=2950537 RepID=A0ABU2G1C2_9EURY|nr:hypothetical protein [Halogeometricum sp. S3BR5-2]MDS0294580.1 hypothetical protein [Halogeometricum sp. S3BR5-2]
MGHCPDCGEELVEVVESDTAAKFSTGRVWECSECGAILGVTKIGT